MTHHIIELAIAAIIAYLLGCCVGCLLRKWFGAEEPVVEAPRVPDVKPMATAGAAAVTAAAASAAAAKLATPERVPPTPPAPAPRPAPMPVAAPVPADPNRRMRPLGIAGPRGGKGDDLLRISGVGPKNQEILHSLGIYHFDQIAKWTPGEGDWVDDHMKFNGRVAREEWINQARLLAAGNEAEFARLYGTGGEGAKEAGLRTMRGSREQEQASTMTSSTTADEEKGQGGKMKRPKGISAARGGKADNLQRISGIGPKNEKILHGLGFYHFDQIAEWTASEIEWVEDHLRFGGRIKREEWTRQARLLADGKEAEFTRLYGTGGLSNNKGETLSGSRTRKS